MHLPTTAISDIRARRRPITPIDRTRHECPALAGLSGVVIAKPTIAKPTINPNAVVKLAK